MKQLIPYIFVMLFIGGCGKSKVVPSKPVIPLLPCQQSTKNFAGLYVSKKNYKDTINLVWVYFNCPNINSSVYVAGNIGKATNKYLKSPLPLDTTIIFYSNEVSMTAMNENKKFQFVKQDSLYILWLPNQKTIDPIYFRKLQ